MQSFTHTILPWLGTYALHSTALLLTVAWLVRVLPRESHRAQEWLWRAALLGPLVTTGLQAGLPFDPALGRFAWPEALPDPVSANKSEPRDGTATPLLEEVPAPGFQDWLAAAPESIDAPSLAFESDPSPLEANPLGLTSVPAERPRVRRPNRMAGPFARTTDRLESAAVQAPVWVESEVVGALPADFVPRSESESVGAALGTLQPSPGGKPAATRSPWSWTGALFALWTVGGVFGLALLGTAWRRLMDRIAGRKPITSGPLVDILQDLCDRAHRKHRPRLSLSPKLGSPATVGILRSQICVPALAIEGLSVPQQRAMLGHELAHILRRDPLWFFLYRLVERVFFFQPLNRYARKQVQELAEFQCDDWAAQQLGHGLDLARCLTEVASWLLREKPQVALLPMAGAGSMLGHRVRRLLDEESRQACARKRPWALPLAASLLASAAWALPSFEGAPKSAHESTTVRSEDSAKTDVPALEQPLPAEMVADAGEPSALPEATNGFVPRPETPLAASEQSPAGNAEESLAPSSTPQDGLDRFAAELDELERWIRDLESQAETLGQQDRYRDSLQSMRRQIHSLRSKQRRLQVLMQRLP